MMLARGVMLLLIGGQAIAQPIFNVSPSLPQRPLQTPSLPTAPAVTVPQPVQAMQPSSRVDPKVMAQFDQLPNESNEAYLNRLKVLSQRAVADMERVSREQNAKIQALAPK